MGDQQIDLSGGFVPKSTPAPSSSGASGVDLSGGFVPKAPDLYAHYGMDAKGKISNRQMQAAKDYDTDKGNFVPNTDTSGDMIDNSYEPSDEALKSVGVDPGAYRGNKDVAIKTALTGGSVPQMDHNGNITGTALNPAKAARSIATAIPRTVGGIYHAAVDPVTADEQQSALLNNSTTGAEAHRGPGLMAKRLLVDPQAAELKKAADSYQQGNYADAAAHGIGGAIPLVGPMAASAAEGLTSNSGDEQADAVGNLIGGLTIPEVSGKALNALPKSVPRSALSKTIQPADPVDFHAAEQSAIPKVNAAAQDLGQPIKTADDAIAAIRQAKQNTLLDAHESAGPGKTIADLPPEQLAALQKDMSALDTLDKHIQSAQETAAESSAKPQPTAADSIKQIAAGGAKVAAGAAVSPIPIVGKAAGMLGLFKGTPEIMSGVKNLLAKRALTPENLDSAIQQTFGKVDASPRSADVPADVPSKVPYQPVAGDLTVQHEGNIQPPELPHGDATVLPDKPNPAIVASGSTANAPASQPRPIGPNVRPAASTTELDSSLPRNIAPAPTETAPPVKQPLTATTPAAQTAEVLKKAGIQQALKDAGVAAPSATIRQIRPGIDIGPTLQPRMDLSFYGDKTGEGAALMQLTRYNINELRAMAVSRGLDVAPGDSHVALIDKIHDDLSPAEIKEFNDAATERGISPRGTKPKRGYQQSAATVQPQAEAQPASEPAPQADRRQNVDLRAAVDSMSPEDQVKAIYQSDKTGLPNKRAFDWAETNQGPAKAIGMSDADGLKALNDKYGYAAGDALLKAKAEALQEAGLQAFHDKGDEFMFRGESPEDMNTKLDKAKELLQNRVIRFTGADGKMHEFSGANFSAGVGSDLESAEAALKTQKAARKASGDAGERGTLGKIKEIK